MLNYRVDDKHSERLAKILNNTTTVQNKDNVINIELECIICTAIIPVERQRLILTIKTSCEYCAGCQDLMDRKTHATM